MNLHEAYPFPVSIPWATLAAPLAEAEDRLARLDERLSQSPIRDGFMARGDFADACACLWLAGELVHMEDLVLHDAAMDIRAPTHELTRAHAALRARRRIARATPEWALSPAGISSLTGQSDDSLPADQSSAAAGSQTPAPETSISIDPLADVFASIDAAIASAERTLSGTDTSGKKKPVRNPLVYDQDWSEADRLATWRKAVDQTQSLPPVLAAAIAMDAWESIAPLQHMPWLGRLLAAALLRARGKTQSHLASLHVGMKAMPRERRRQAGYGGLALHIAAITAAADAGLRDHDRWRTAHTLLNRKLAGRRSTSHLAALVAYVMETPIISTAMVAAKLDVSPRAAQNLIAELSLRELTGRGRYRAWGII